MNGKMGVVMACVYTLALVVIVLDLFLWRVV